MFFGRNFYLNNIKFDKYQTRAIFCNSKRYLVVAGAGSGKTLVIVGKIKYLIEKMNISSDKILCISFTNETVNSLIKSLDKNNISVDVKTFHKLSLDIISSKRSSIVSSNFLEYVVDEFFSSIIYHDNSYKLLFSYLDNNDLEYDNFINNFKNIVVTFIKLFKSYGYPFSYFLTILYDDNVEYNDKLLLVLIFKIYVLYEEELDSTMSIDFDDMIVLAIKKIKNLSYFRYKYIIIDEFQDTSFTKFCLIKGLIEKFDIGLMVVGDDFQSIYSFAGCDINLFLNFKKNFLDAKIVKLKYNYRNPKDIVDISCRFVLKNKSQMKKRIKSNNFICESIIVVYSKTVVEDICHIIDELDDIFILGRNNKDLDFLIDNYHFCYKDDLIYLKDVKKKIRFLTVHSAKGLESDYVILLNVVDDVLGFPNKIIDNDLYKYLKLNKEKFLYAEERRLFYVALTRAKKRVYLFTKRGKESLFILELIKDYGYKLKTLDFE